MQFHVLRPLLILLPFFLLAQPKEVSENYLNYHRLVSNAEELLVKRQFKKALANYDVLVKKYDFVFERDLKIAAQLAFYLNEPEKAIAFSKRALAAGWTVKSIGRNPILKGLKQHPQWQELEDSYKASKQLNASRVKNNTRIAIRQLYKKDQRKAMGALFRIGARAKARYANNKFLPHSIIQMKKLIRILEDKGYPGEKEIGNDYWVSTIISHHNSISREYTLKDTLYSHIKPKLLLAIESGQMSPYELALIDDWQKAVASDRTAVGYGYLSRPNKSTLEAFNALRQAIGLRTIETRNKLVDLQQEIGMDFFLPDWIDGKIEILTDQ